MSKVCNNCGKTVDDNANFCPTCKGTSFKNKYEVVEADNTPVHRLLYWQYDGGYMVSKAKVAGIASFLLWTLAGIGMGTALEMMIFGIGFGFLVFFLGFGLHRLLSKPSQDKLVHNDYGLVTDLKHFFFYWQNREGQYVISKTKVVSFFIFLMFFGISLATSATFGIAMIVAIILTAPAFAVGCGIHLLTNPNPKAPDNYIEPSKEPSKVKLPKRMKPKSIQKAIIPEYMGYVTQLDELNSKFKSKEKSARDLIEKRFEPPQLTYTRFIGGVDKAAELFKKHSDSAYNMINLADEYSPRIAGEIESKIGILTSIIEKMDDLANELVLSGDISKKEDVDNVIGEMDNLINSVKDYDK